MSTFMPINNWQKRDISKEDLSTERGHIGIKMVILLVLNNGEEEILRVEHSFTMERGTELKPSISNQIVSPMQKTVYLS